MLRAVSDFVPLREAEPRVDRIGNAIATVRRTVCLGELHPAAPVDTDHTGEPGRRRNAVDRALEVVHAPTVAAIQAFDSAPRFREGTQRRVAGARSAAGWGPAAARGSRRCRAGRGLDRA